MLNNKYWFKLLSHFENKGYIHNGLTIPFIIGSRRFIQPFAEIQDIEELINDFRTSGHFISIFKCNSIGEFVLNISNENDKLIYGGFENFVFIDNSFSDIKSFEELNTYFKERYSEKIRKEQYSLNSGKWTYFTEIELKRLEEIKK